MGSEPLNVPEVQVLKPKGEETPEEKRRREILEIKKQLDEINKKMDITKSPSEQSNQLSTKPKNSGVAQSMIFTSSTEKETQQFKVTKVGNSETSPSLLDKLYEQKKTLPKQSEQTNEEFGKKPSFLQPKTESFQITKKEPILTKEEYQPFKQPPLSYKEKSIPYKEPFKDQSLKEQPKPYENKFFEPKPFKKEMEENILSIDFQKEELKTEFTQPTTP